MQGGLFIARLYDEQTLKLYLNKAFMDSNEACILRNPSSPK